LSGLLVTLERRIVESLANNKFKCKWKEVKQ
jgi:hypothetical protein